MRLYCPCCHLPDAAVTVNVADPTEFFCTECEENFTREGVVELQEKVAKWTRVLAWADQCPREEKIAK